MKYLKKFPNLSFYRRYIQNNPKYSSPNVSLIISPREVKYNDYDPTNGYDYIEIAGTNWATMNIGALDPTEPGLYFQWGDILGYNRENVGNQGYNKYFGWEDYIFGDGTSSTANISKYNNEDELIVLELEDDAARENWGGKWVIPSKEDFQNLIQNTTQIWQEDGILFKQDNKELFFPYTGACSLGQFVSEDPYFYPHIGGYWSNRRNNGSFSEGVCLTIGAGNNNSAIEIDVSSSPRYIGLAIRPILILP